MSAPVRIQPTAVFELAHRPEEIAADLRLRSLEWGVLFSLTGRHSVAQIGAQLALAPEARDRAFAELLVSGLIVERKLSLGEYLRSAGTVESEERRTLAALLRGAPARPPAVPPVGPATEPPRPAERTATSGDGVAAPATVSVGKTPPPARPSAAFRPLSLPEEESPMNRPSRSRRALDLRALNQLFFDRADSPEAAQLDLYRIYLRVDAQRLRNAGITTLRFDEARQVEDPELIERLVRSAEESLGAPLPEAVWVEMVVAP